MKNRETIKKRFLKEPLPIKLGHLASDLSRISFFCRQTEEPQLLNDVLEESKFFIEWVVPETDIELAAWLAQIQIKLSLWQLNWQSQMKQSYRIRRVATLTKMWSAKLLKRAGLIK